MRRSTYRRLRFRNVWSSRIARHRDTLSFAGHVAGSLAILVIVSALTAAVVWQALTSA